MWTNEWGLRQHLFIVNYRLKQHKCAGCAILLNLVVQRNLLWHMEMDTQKSGPEAIRTVLSQCNVSEYSELMRTLLTVAHNMLFSFWRMHSEYGYEEPWTGRYPPIEDLLDIEGDRSVTPSILSVTPKFPRKQVNILARSAMGYAAGMLDKIWKKSRY